MCPYNLHTKIPPTKVCRLNIDKGALDVTFERPPGWLPF